MRANRHSIDLSAGRMDALFYPGRRTAVLLLHGNSAYKETFAAQVEMLRSHDFAVVTLDLPGHGASSDAKVPRETYSFPGYAATVAGVLDAFGIDRADVVGWSLGGHIGLELMGQDRRVQSLLIYGTPPVKPGPDVLQGAFRNSAMNFAGQQALSPEECRTYAEAMAGGAGLSTCDLEDSIQRTDGRARMLMVQNALYGIGLDEVALVAHDPRPLAVLHGGQDDFINLDYLVKLSYRNLWNGAVHVLPQAGHAAHLQTPATFNALLLSFLLSSGDAPAI